MTFDSATPLDQLTSGGQQEVVFNTVTAAMSPAALYGIKPYVTAGLSLALYGGNWPNSDGTIATIADQIIALTASATNYIYATIAGVVTKVTSAPAGWPGPLASSARALYQLTVDANGITGGTDYVTGVGIAGPAGPTGATGPAGSEPWQVRRRVYEIAGDGSSGTTASMIGFTSGPFVGNSSGISFDPATYGAMGGMGCYVYSTGGPGPTTVQHTLTNNLWHRGSAAGRGGFKITIRLATPFFNQAGHQRNFFGLYDFATGTIGDVEPDTLLNTIGFGKKKTDTNLSFMSNDGTGAATMVALGANFPAETLYSVYEMSISALPNDSLVSWAITNIGTGNTASGTANTKIPANNQFLCGVVWGENVDVAGGHGFAFMQFVGESRY